MHSIIIGWGGDGGGCCWDEELAEVVVVAPFRVE